MKRYFFILLVFLLLYSCTPDGRFDESQVPDSMLADSTPSIDTFSVKRPQPMNEAEKIQAAIDKKEVDSIVNNASQIIHQGDPDRTDKIADAVGVVMNPDIGPSFPGGSDAMDRYIDKHRIYPLVAFQNDIKGTVRLKVVVSSDGKIGGIEVLKGLGYGCDESAIDLVRGMPAWVPGKKGGANVRCAVTLAISFGQ